MEGAREAFEAELHLLHAQGRLREVATRVLGEYGGEVLGFLANVTGSRDEASVVFSQVCEDLWVGLPAFRFGCSLRTWMYTLARNATHRARLEPFGRKRVAISDHPELLEVEARVRTTTLTYLRSETKDRVRRLREELEPDDRTILVLRIDRDMSWNEVAAIMLGDRVEDEATRTQHAAWLRKRFERIKERLRAMLAREEAARRA